MACCGTGHCGSLTVTVNLLEISDKDQLGDSPGGCESNKQTVTVTVTVTALSNAVRPEGYHTMIVSHGVVVFQVWSPRGLRYYGRSQSLLFFVAF